MPFVDGQVQCDELDFVSFIILPKLMHYQSFISLVLYVCSIIYDLQEITLMRCLSAEFCKCLISNLKYPFNDTCASNK